MPRRQLSELLAGMTSMPPPQSLLAIVRRIAVEQIPDYFLILTSMLLGNVLEEVNARLTQIERYLYRILFEDQFFRPGQEILHDFYIPDTFRTIFYFLFHISAFLSSNTLLR
jgi:hypothetical protein